MSRTKCLTILAWLLLFSSALAVEVQVEVFELRSRSADEVVSLIGPHLPEGSVVTGDGATLVVRSTSGGLDQVRALLAKIDVAKKMLMISVRHGADFVSEKKIKSLPKLRRWQTTSREDSKDIQMIKTLEGEPAFITTGKAIPVLDYTYGLHGLGGLPAAGIRYEEVPTGFFAVARVVGDEVLLALSEERNNLARDGLYNINFNRSDANMRVPLGEWVQVAGTHTEIERNKNAILYSTGNRQKGKNEVFIKVEVLE